MEKFWLKEYAPGVPAEVDNGGFRSLRDLIETSFKEYGGRPAYTCMDVTLSYADLDRLSRHMAAWLQERAGLSKGDRIAIMLPNILQYPVVLCAALRAGLVIVNVNPLYTPRELEHQLRDSGAKAIVILENFATTLEKVIGETPVETVVTTAVGDLFGTPKRQIVNFVVKRIRKQVPAYDLPGSVSFRDALYDGGSLVFQPPDIDLGDLAFLQYTGGTTGVAKGAMLSHRNLVYNVEQSTAWLGAKLDPDQDVVAITALPLYHIFSLEGNCLGIMKLGGHNILIPNPRDFQGFVKELSKYPFTYFTGVNTLFSGLLNTPGFADLDFSSLQITVGGGMAVQEPVARRWKEVTGNTLTQAYGLTETSPAAVINPITDDAAFNGSIGLPISSTEVSIRDDNGGEVPGGEVGEICIRGPQVMEGYWNHPEETEKVMLEGGWFRTGDMGRMDDRGYVYIEDRKKDMILVSGFNVYPNEIEEVIAEMDSVLEVAAVGQPDERAGEVVKVFVVRKVPSLTEKAVVAHCRENLTGYKVPKVVEFRDELPKTNVGKILRRALRDEEQ
ncbi:AMP-binding protein [Lentisalinibacter sediminis]|uniref:AMP-binding protein n=1 Tax=Lentisalinibacter sediminis TaxID=2992237 RepID=UPI0038679639